MLFGMAGEIKFVMWNQQTYRDHFIYKRDASLKGSWIMWRT